MNLTVITSGNDRGCWIWVNLRLPNPTSRCARRDLDLDFVNENHGVASGQPMRHLITWVLRVQTPDFTLMSEPECTKSILSLCQAWFGPGHREREPWLWFWTTDEAFDNLFRLQTSHYLVNLGVSNQTSLCQARSGPGRCEREPWCCFWTAHEAWWEFESDFTLTWALESEWMNLGVPNQTSVPGAFWTLWMRTMALLLDIPRGMRELMFRTSELPCFGSFGYLESVRPGHGESTSGQPARLVRMWTVSQCKNILGVGVRAS